MQIGQPVVVGLVDENRVHVGDVQPAFDDRRGDQDVALAANEPEHGVLQLMLVHLPVADRDSRFRHDALKPVGHLADVVDAIVDEIDLAVAIEFTNNRMANELRIEPGDARFDGQPVGRRRFQVTDVADAQKGQMQSARDGGRRQGQHIHRLAQPFQPFLVLDAETLFLVDDDQAEILEVHVGADQPMRADDDVDPTLGQPLQDALSARRRSGIG